MTLKRTSLVTTAIAVMALTSGLHGQQTSSESSDSSATVAEDGTLPHLTANSPLSDYRRYAALNNPELEAAFNQWKAALEKIPQAKSLPDPRFSYRYFIRQIETRVGPQRQAFEISQGVSVSDKNTSQDV